MVLLKMKETAEAYLRGTINNSVVTVPAYFNAILSSDISEKTQDQKV